MKKVQIIWNNIKHWFCAIYKVLLIDSKDRYKITEEMIEEMTKSKK